MILIILWSLVHWCSFLQRYFDLLSVSFPFSHCTSLGVVTSNTCNPPRITFLSISFFLTTIPGFSACSLLFLMLNNHLIPHSLKCLDLATCHCSIRTSCPHLPFLFLNFFFIVYFFIFLILKSLILTCVPKHEPPSHLPPHNISLGHPHAPAPSMLYPASILLLIITSFRRLGTEKRNAKTWMGLTFNWAWLVRVMCWPLLHGVCINVTHLNRTHFPKSSHNLQWCHRYASYWLWMMREKAYHRSILEANTRSWRQWTWDSFLSGVSMAGRGEPQAFQAHPASALPSSV